jgi:hypothetical protein
MARYKVGDTVVLQGRRARVVWLSENATEIEAMDEYIVEFEDKHRRFVVSGELGPKKRQPVNDRDHDRNPSHRQAY